MFNENLDQETRDMIDRFTDEFHDAVFEEGIEEQHRDNIKW